MDGKKEAILLFAVPSPEGPVYNKNGEQPKNKIKKETRRRILTNIV